MSLSVVWIDLQRAKLFHFSEDRMERELIEADPKRVDHHTHPLENDEKYSWSMYDKIAEKLARAKRVLILGPGVAKTQFHNRVKDQYPQVAKRVVGCEASDHPSDVQIAAYAMKFLQKPVA